MANNPSIPTSNIQTPLDAIDALSQAESMIEFLQDSLTLAGDKQLNTSISTAGLYYVFADIRDRITAASAVLDDLRISKD